MAAPIKSLDDILKHKQENQKTYDPQEVRKVTVTMKAHFDVLVNEFLLEVQKESGIELKKSEYIRALIAEDLKKRGVIDDGFLY